MLKCLCWRKWWAHQSMRYFLNLRWKVWPVDRTLSYYCTSPQGIEPFFRSVSSSGASVVSFKVRVSLTVFVLFNPWEETNSWGRLIRILFILDELSQFCFWTSDHEITYWIQPQTHLFVLDDCMFPYHWLHSKGKFCELLGDLVHRLCLFLCFSSYKPWFRFEFKL